ncbi:MAG: penicillin-binding protein 2 [Pedobacter sp.]|nr:MAG: penicillin-binding protein 2 [Pedobacter sp.]
MDQLFNRKYIIQGLFVLIALILLGKLFYMQVVSDRYFLSANNNALRKIYTYPARGVILDRNNKVLAQNQPTYDLLVTPNQVKEFDTLSLCSIIGIDTIEFRKKFDKAVSQSRFQESILQKLISVETYAALQEKMFNFRGFSVRKRTIRFYPDSIAAQFLGYMREVTPTDLEKYQGYYKPGDYIGKGGIEKKYEIDLRGTKGVTHMLFNSKNVAQGSYNNGKLDSAAIPGEQLVTTIDSRIQKLGEELTFNCPGYYVAGNRKFKCEHIDGPIALRKGIARSCNTYFYTIFAKLMTKNGGSYAKQQNTYEDWQNKVRKFGIGDTLGIDFPGEKAYKLFRKADYDKVHSKYWGNTTIMSVAIGQGEINTTPLQMANIMAIIANRGYYLKPHVVKVIGNGKGIDPRFKEKHFAGIDARFYEPVIDGMQDAVNTQIGTAIESKLPNIIMCGKTGTVQNSRGKNHSVFIGFAPRDNPKIAIAVIVENGGYGGAYAAPIASFIAEKYLTDSLSGRTINGSTIQMYKDANLLPNFLSKPFRPKSKTDSLLNKTDSLKKALPVKSKNTNNAFNKVADKPKTNATSK